jgi:hypothetical protein
MQKQSLRSNAPRHSHSVGNGRQRTPWRKRCSGRIRAVRAPTPPRPLRRLMANSKLERSMTTACGTPEVGRLKNAFIGFSLSLANLGVPPPAVPNTERRGCQGASDLFPPKAPPWPQPFFRVLKWPEHMEPFPQRRGRTKGQAGWRISFAASPYALP